MRFNSLKRISLVVIAVALVLYLFKDKGFRENKECLQTNCSRLQSIRNLVVCRYDNHTTEILDGLVSRRAMGNDPELIKVIRSLLDPPSNKHPVKLSRYLIKTPQAEEVDIILNKKTEGFFLEAGALDGERSSNSIFLEMHRKWTGLLVEVDPLFYIQLIGKNRRSWSINACLSPYDYVTRMNFVESSDGTGKLKIGSQDSSNNVDNANGAYCFPVDSLLAALNQTVVDFLSLDVEGVELDILKTIPFDRLNFRVMAVEYIHGNKTQYKEFMSKRGFYVHKDISYQKPVIGLYVEDFIFVNNSTLKLGSPVK